MESTFERSRSGLYIPKKLGKLLSNFYAFRRLGDPLFNRLGARGLPWGFGQVAGFIPSDIDGLLLWVAANLGLSLNDGDPVATWPDQSGNGNDVAQAVAAKRPTFFTGIVNGLPIVRFDGIDDSIENSIVTFGPQPNTLFAVANYDSTGPATQIIITGQVAGPNLENAIFVSTPAANPVFSIFGGVVLTGSDFSDALHAFSALMDGVNSAGYVDGNLDISGNAGATAYLGAFIGSTDGGGNFLKGDIAEILVYEDGLSDSDRQLVEQYLIAKYGL